MRSSNEKYTERANLMANVVASVVYRVTGIPVDVLRSDDCSRAVTRARFMFVDLCTGVVGPMAIISDYLRKNTSMIAYYKRSHNEHYEIYNDFRKMSDEADRMLTELLTTINGNTGNVFQEEE